MTGIISSIVLQLEFQVQSNTTGQVALAVFILALMFAIMIIVGYRSRYYGLSDSEKKHKESITGSKFDQTPKSIRIPRGRSLETYRDSLRSLFDRDDLAPVDDRTTVRRALTEVRAAFRESYAPVVDRVPLFSLRLFQLAGLIAVLGSVAVSTDWFIRQLARDGELPSASYILERAIEITVDIVSTGVDVVGSFPYAGTLFSLAFAYTVTLWEYFYTHWYLVAFILLFGGVVIWELERRIQATEIDTRLYHDRIGLAYDVSRALSITWLSGVVPAYIFDRIGFTEIGALIGFLVATVMFLIFGVLGVRELIGKLKTARYRDFDTAGNVISGYILARQVWGVVAIASLPLIPAYLLVAIASGRLTRILEAFMNATFNVKLIVLSGLLSLILVFGLMVRSSYPEVKSAWLETMSRRSVKASLLGKAVPWTAVGIAYLIAYSFLRSFVPSLLIALITGLMLYVLYKTALRARYKVAVYESGDRLPSRLVVLAYVLQDNDDDVHYYAVVNDHAVAADSIDGVVDAIIGVGEGLFIDGEAAPSVASWYARDLTRQGVVDAEHTYDRVREKVRKYLLYELRSNNHLMEREELEDALEAFPESVVSDRLTEYRRMGFLNERDEYVSLEYDPFIN